MNNIGSKFFTGVNYSTTLVANLPQVSKTPAEKFATGVNNTGRK
jgi:hypothetical protein